MIQVFYVGLQLLLALIGHGASAHHTEGRGNPARAAAGIPLVIFRERLNLTGPVPGSGPLRHVTGFKAAEPLADVGEKARLALFTIAYDVHTGFRLFPDNFGHGLTDPVCVGLLIVRLAVLFGFHRPQQVVRARQTAGVCGKNPFGAVLHAVAPIAKVGVCPAADDPPITRVAW